MSSPAGPAPSPLPPAVSSAPDPWALSTDPTGFDAVESLYRQADGSARRTSGVRHFQPALRPPEDTDGYGWLYRPAETAGPVTGPAPSTATAGLAVATPAPSPDPEPSWSVPAEPRRRRWPALLLLTAALLGTVLLALVAPGTL